MTKASDRRRTLTSVDKELRTLAASTIELLVSKGLAPEGAAETVKALEFEAPSGARFRIEFADGKATTLPAPSRSRRDDSRASEPRKNVTPAQKALIKRLSEEHDITTIDGHSLDKTSIAALDLLPGSQPRETATAIITALEGLER